MSGIRIENPWLKLFSLLSHKERRRKFPKDVEDKRTLELKNLVKKAMGVIRKFVRKLNKAENYKDIIDNVLQNDLIMDLDLEQTKNYVDKLCEDLNDLIPKLSENQSGGPLMEDINIQLDNVKRFLFFLSCFSKHFVLNLKRIIRLPVPNEVIPENLPQLPDFLKLVDRSWDIIYGAPNHFLLKANWREHILEYHEWHYLSNEPSFEGIKGEQNVFITGKGTKLPDFEESKFKLLRFLSLRKVNLKKGIEENLENLSSLKYLDLKHTTVKHCSWLERLEKLEMLDLRCTTVKEIDEKYLKKLGNLQHLLLGNVKEEGENQFAGTKLDLKTLKEPTNLKTLRTIEQPDAIEEISIVSNVVDLSVTGLTEKNLQNLWVILENFENLSSLGVAVTHQSTINLQDCRPKLKEKLKRLRMEGLRSGLDELPKFVNLIDLTLSSHKAKDSHKSKDSHTPKDSHKSKDSHKPKDSDKLIHTNIIPVLSNLLCLRLYGFCQQKNFRIGLEGFDKLMKLVLGDMGNVKTVEIGCDVIESVATLKLSNLRHLKKVVYLDKQDPNKQHSLLRWGKKKANRCSTEVQLHKTIFLRHFPNVPVDKSPGLMIYHYDMNQQCYEYIKHNP